MEICNVCEVEPVQPGLDYLRVVKQLRMEYILEDYPSMTDSWKILQGIIYYREYRGLGQNARPVDKQPRPCCFCLNKLIYLSKSVYDLTTTLEKPVEHDSSSSVVGQTSVQRETPQPQSRPPPPPRPQPLQQAPPLPPLQQPPPRQQPLQPRSKTSPSIARRRGPHNASVVAETSPLAAGQQQAAERPRRPRGRSLNERNPDFVSFSVDRTSKPHQATSSINSPAVTTPTRQTRSSPAVQPPPPPVSRGTTVIVKNTLPTTNNGRTASAAGASPVRKSPAKSVAAEISALDDADTAAMAAPTTPGRAKAAPGKSSGQGIKRKSLPEPIPSEISSKRTRFPSVRANGGIAAVTSRKAPPSSSPARSQLLPKSDAGTISPAPPTVMKSPGRARSAAAAGNTAGQDSKRKSLPPEPVATEVTSKRTRVPSVRMLESIKSDSSSWWLKIADAPLVASTPKHIKEDDGGPAASPAAASTSSPRATRSQEAVKMASSTPGARSSSKKINNKDLSESKSKGKVSPAKPARSSSAGGGNRKVGGTAAAAVNRSLNNNTKAETVGCDGADAANNTSLDSAMNGADESGEEGEGDDDDDDDEVVEQQDWQQPRFRMRQLALLDKALTEANWFLRSGKNMEREVFKNAKSKEDYISGIRRLVLHFSSPQVSSSAAPKQNSPAKKTASPQKEAANDSTNKNKESPNKDFSKNEGASSKAKTAALTTKKTAASAAAGGKLPAAPAAVGKSAAASSAAGNSPTVSGVVKSVAVPKKRETWKTRASSLPGKSSDARLPAKKTDTESEAVEVQKKTVAPKTKAKAIANNLYEQTADNIAQPATVDGATTEKPAPVSRANKAKSSSAAVPGRAKSSVASATPATAVPSGMVVVKKPLKIAVGRKNVKLKEHKENIGKLAAKQKVGTKTLAKRRKKDNLTSAGTCGVSKRASNPRVWGKQRKNCPVCGILQGAAELASHLKKEHGVTNYDSTKVLPLPQSSADESQTDNEGPPAATVEPVSDQKPLKLRFIVKKSRTGKKGKRYLEPEESMQDLEAAIQAKAIIPKAANSEKRPEQVGALVGADKDRSGGPTLLHHNFGEDVNFDGTGRLESGINKKIEGTDSGSDKSKEDAAFDQLLAASRPQRRTRSIEERNPDFVMSSNTSKRPQTSADETNKRPAISTEMAAEGPASVTGVDEKPPDTNGAVNRVKQRLSSAAGSAKKRPASATGSTKKRPSSVTGSAKKRPSSATGSIIKSTVAGVVKRRPSSAMAYPKVNTPPPQQGSQQANKKGWWNAAIPDDNNTNDVAPSSLASGDDLPSTEVDPKPNIPSRQPSAANGQDESAAAAANKTGGAAAADTEGGVNNITTSQKIVENIVNGLLVSFDDSDDESLQLQIDEEAGRSDDQGLDDDNNNDDDGDVREGETSTLNGVDRQSVILKTVNQGLQDEGDTVVVKPPPAAAAAVGKMPASCGNMLAAEKNTPEAQIEGQKTNGKAIRSNSMVVDNDDDDDDVMVMPPQQPVNQADKWFGINGE